MYPPDDETFSEVSADGRPRLMLVLVTLLLVLSMLATLLWPLLRAGARRQVTPTPTPVYWQQARSAPGHPLPDHIRST